MNTWSCKASLAALALTALAACSPGQDNPFSALTGQSAPVSQAAMAGGAVTITAPGGYCFDPRSLGQRFALLARCDVLSKNGNAGVAPLSLITISVSPAKDAVRLPTAEQITAAHSLSNLTNKVQTEQSILFRADGAAPAPGLSERHWRGAGRVANHIVGFALYTPKETEVGANRARAILTALIDGTVAGG